MKKHVAAIIAIFCPTTVIGFAGGYEIGVVPFWGLLAISSVCIWAEWWGLKNIDGKDE